MTPGSEKARAGGGGSRETPLEIGFLAFPSMDELDMAGPFSVLSRLSGARLHLIWKRLEPIADGRGLLFTPTTLLAGAPRLDLLVVPGGWGQEELMEDEEILGFLRSAAADARYLLSVCTGALLCGAAGLLVGRRATTHWASHHLLSYFGARPVHERVVVDGKLVSAAGVTSGIDGALRVVALIRGEEAARAIQLTMEYAPEPPFDAGSPDRAPEATLSAVKASLAEITRKRLERAERIAARLGLRPPAPRL